MARSTPQEQDAFKAASVALRSGSKFVEAAESIDERTLGDGGRPQCSEKVAECGSDHQLASDRPFPAEAASQEAADHVERITVGSVEVVRATGVVGGGEATQAEPKDNEDTGAVPKGVVEPAEGVDEAVLRLQPDCVDNMRIDAVEASPTT